MFRCPISPLLYWSFKCNVELFHLQRCFSTQYKIPHHPSPPANQFTSSRSLRNKASLSSTVPLPTHPPHIQCCFTFVRDELGCEFDDNYAPFLIRQNLNYRVLFLYIFFFHQMKISNASTLDEYLTSLIYFNIFDKKMFSKTSENFSQKFMKNRCVYNFWHRGTEHA